MKAKRNVGSKARTQPVQMSKVFEKINEDAAIVAHYLRLVYRTIESSGGSSLGLDEIEALEFILGEAAERIDSVCAASYGPALNQGLTEDEEKEAA